MEEFKMANARYIYIRDVHKVSSPPHAMDTHHIVYRRNVVTYVLVYISALLFNAYAFFLFLFKDNSLLVVIWSLLVSALLVKLLIWNPVFKESIIIMPAFGVQFETHYGSGKINRCFVPAGKILKPVLNECVTPVTCYWCFSLLIRGQEELMLVFKEFQLPMKMLVPIWKALCAALEPGIEKTLLRRPFINDSVAIDSEGSSGALKDDML